ncbi:hypothetical protein [Seonamhaeicola marinus]|uniref:Uncharacterized protein n=1 Tax=Seonamhaeicola marinus TaxID=1912246 RepID=A0A5D0HT23_9FLAO|nr:hypothetical protein [Seonamhaeicola marinus]TYA74523.1 hypothetical protein FUA24_14475 [Seonamhaeicola marinus]
MKYLAILLFILIPNLSTNAQKELIPLKVNNKWTYLQTEWHNGKIVKKDTSYSIIKRSKSINGKTWYVSNEDGENYIVRDVNGEQFEFDEEDHKEFLVFGLPKNEKQRSYMVYQEQVTVLKKQVKIKTKLGTFKCYKYEFRAPDDSNHFIDTYICPGVGIVKVEMGSDNEKTVLLLINLKLY